MTRVLAVTPGEPAGIGPELLVRLAQEDRQQAWVAVADSGLLERTAHRLGVSLALEDCQEKPVTRAGRLAVQHVPLAEFEQPGELNPANAAYVLQTLTVALQGAMAGRFDALVTGPVQKSVINDAGVAFSGHTEFFCEGAGADDVVMLLVAGSLKVALATTHLPLAAVAGAITPELLVRRLDILIDGLRTRFGVAAPRVLVAGLNPHAGEGGHLGTEEIEIIEPVCEGFRARGVDLVGPMPADTLFTPTQLAGADAVFAMYHDQGLPVLKAQGFGQAVNITLGLPFLRTSVDHGTALDLAGRGVADPASFREALRLASVLAA